MRLLKVLVNSICVITFPVWGGLVITGAFFHDAIDNPDGDASKTLRGDKWFWQMF